MPISVNGRPVAPGDHDSIMFVMALLVEYQAKVHALAETLALLTARQERQRPPEAPPSKPPRRPKRKRIDVTRHRR